jgi:hypothetical protein
MKVLIALPLALTAAVATSPAAIAGQSYDLKLHAPDMVAAGQVFNVKATGTAFKKSRLQVVYHQGTSKCAANVTKENDAGAAPVIEGKKVGPGTFKVKQKYFFGYAGKYRLCGYLVPLKSSSGKPAAHRSKTIKVTAS